ncbi:hypothetical protein BVY05_20750 [Pectobacterium odoriferum]|nr:hypothetical protein BVY05_20750 [Pectobacterium odoriferum]
MWKYQCKYYLIKKENNMLNYINIFWNWIGDLKTPQATLIAAIATAIVAYFTISKNRKTAREKNAIEFEIFCQTDNNFIKHWNVVRKIIIPIFSDGEVNKEKQKDILLKYINNSNNKLIIKRKSLKLKLKSETIISDIEKIRSEIRDIEKTIKGGTSILYVLNTWERCANAIRHGVYDEKYIYTAQGTMVILIYDALKPYIDSRKKASPRVFLNIEWLATKWSLKHTIHGKIPNKTQKTIEMINVARIRIHEHKFIKRCYNSLYLSYFKLLSHKKPKC